jgi:hypothetical protein
LKGKYDDLMAYINRLNRFQSMSSPAPIPPVSSPGSASVTPLNTSNLSSTSSSQILAAASSSSSSSSSIPLNINHEYLKNCIYKYMTSTNISEKQRLYKVIAMILQFTNKEIKNIELIIQEEVAANPSDQISSAIHTISDSFGYWFGGNNTGAVGVGGNRQGISSGGHPPISASLSSSGSSSALSSSASQIKKGSSQI